LPTTLLSAPAGLYFEERAQRFRADEGPHPVSDGIWRVDQEFWIPAVQGLGDLSPFPETRFSVLGSQPFQSGLSPFLFPLMPYPQSIAGAVYTPAFRIEAVICKLARLARDHGGIPSLPVSLQPLAHGPHVQGVELPLDLLVIPYRLIHLLAGHLKDENLSCKAM
jgi:hypothetical protein